MRGAEGREFALTGAGRSFGHWRAAPSTPELWDRLWSRGDPFADPRSAIAAEEARVRWRKIAAFLAESPGTLAGRRAIELGAGAGLYSAALACRGVRVTLVDYSPRALDLAAARFARLGLTGEFVLCDGRRLPPELDAAFDIAMSFGTLEHLRGKERDELWQAHARVLRPGGALIASVPNRAFLPHRLFKLALQMRGRWWCGYERTLGRHELLRVARRLDLVRPRVVGTCFVADCRRTWRLARETRLGQRLFGVPRRRAPSETPDAPAGWWDDYLGHEIVLLGRKRRAHPRRVKEAGGPRRVIASLATSDARVPGRVWTR